MPGYFWGARQVLSSVDFQSMAPYSDGQQCYWRIVAPLLFGMLQSTSDQIWQLEKRLMRFHNNFIVGPMQELLFLSSQQLHIFPALCSDTKFLLKSAPTVETLDLSKISGNTLSERVNSAYQEIVPA